jgi:hypothetical protein
MKWRPSEIWLYRSDGFTLRDEGMGGVTLQAKGKTPD